MKKFLAASLALAGAVALNSASAATIAIFGNNSIATFLDVAHDVTVVTDAQLATPGFLNPFDLFIYTRDGFGFGASLTPAAAANVKSFVQGNVVLFTSDLADNGFPGDATNTLMSNAVAFAGNKGYIGEFPGACAAMATNDVGLTPLGLIAGNCDDLNFGPGGDPMDILKNLHPVVAGVPDPVNLSDSHEFFALLSGVDQNLILAVNSRQIPSIVATPDNGTPVPEPTTLALLGAGLAAAGALRRRRR